MSRCIAVASGKGGVGKSTVTANMGAALAMNGKRVLIIDADIGLRSLDALLALENMVVYDLIDLAEGNCLPEQCILPCETVPSLFLLPAAQFSRVKSLSAKKLSRVITILRSGYDFILIDCPAGIERGLRNVLNACPDETILVATPDDLSLRSAERASQVIAAKNLPAPSLIMNRLDPVLIGSGKMMSAKTASEVLDLRLLGEIPEDPSVYRAQLCHDLFIRYDCEARGAMMRIASRICGEDIRFPSYGSRRPSVFHRLFSGKMREVKPLDDH